MASIKRNADNQRYFVHYGFDRALGTYDKKAKKPAFEYLLELLHQHIVEKRKIYVIGHSLGGALAVLANVRYKSLFDKH